MPLSGHLGALAGDLGCFPLDDGAYPPPSHWLTATFAQYSEFASIWYRSRSPHRNSALPLGSLANRCASTHFGENQLAPGSSGISPLSTTHPLIFQHQSVRPSTWFHPSFSLIMDRSPGFGSINSDIRPWKTRFCYGSGAALNRATAYKSPAHSSTGTRSKLHSFSHCL